MKKTSTSRLKKLPLLLGTLLIISVAAYGTRAYFSDSETQQANIKLELGNVDVTTTEEDWVITSKKSEANKTEVDDGTNKYTSITNAKPGDAFTRKYTIENTGSLNAEVGIDYSGKYNTAKGTYDDVTKTYTVTEGPFLISISDFEMNFNLAPKAKKTYDITIAVAENTSNDLYNENDGNLDKLVSVFLNETLTINAKQTATK